MSEQIEDSNKKSLKVRISEALEGLPSIEEQLRKFRHLENKK
jgi:hypothetical protein